MKRTPYRSRKILQAARGQECQMRHAVYCNGNPETTVAAHSNDPAHGKGMGQKADDCFICFACSSCHDWYDRRTGSQHDTRQADFLRGMFRTWRLLLDMGILK